MTFIMTFVGILVFIFTLFTKGFKAGFKRMLMFAGVGAVIDIIFIVLWSSVTHF